MLRKILTFFIVINWFAVHSQDGSIIYFEDFENKTNAWTKYNSDQLGKIKNGVYEMSSTTKDALRWYGMQIFIDYRKNFSIETKLKQTRGKTNQGFGMVWGSEGWQNSYFFMITSNGHYSIGIYKEGKHKNIKRWTKSKSIKGFNTFNTLKVEKRGNLYTFYINNEAVYTCRFEKFFGQIHGFMLQNNITVQADYLKITTDNKIVNVAANDFSGKQKKNLGKNINTIYTEIAPIISPDGQTLYFSRVGHPQNIGKKKECDIWYAKKKPDGTWGKAIHAGYPLNNSGVNAVFAVTPDGNALLLEGLYNKDGSFKSEQGVSISYKTKNGWSVPQPLKIDNFYNKNIYETYTISNDMQILIMAIERNDTYGDTDLYISFRKKDGSYSRPKNMGAILNTPGSEATPFLASDGKTLYFCSDGHPGFGSCDIFMTKRLDDTWLHWSKPVNLGTNINSKEWDSYFSLSAKGDVAFLVSMFNSFGAEDIFTMELTPQQRPEPVVLVHGKVLDKKNNNPLAAQIIYEDLKSGKQIGIARSDPATGEYKITLPYGKVYGMRAEADNYIAINENLNLKINPEYKEVVKNLYLAPVKVGEVIVLKNIFFKKGSAELLPESFAELDRLVKILKDNPSMHIEIRGHTDNRGNPQTLQKLSEDRAKAVYNYLISKGISKNRLSVKAFGGSQTIAKNNTEAEHAKNRRVEFKILKL